jgi:hypothetical protein
LILRPLARRIVSGMARPFRLLAMDMADEAVLFHERFVPRRAIGRIRKDLACRIGLVEQPLAQLPKRSNRKRQSPHQLNVEK